MTANGWAWRDGRGAHDSKLVVVAAAAAR